MAALRTFFSVVGAMVCIGIVLVAGIVVIAQFTHHEDATRIDPLIAQREELKAAATLAGGPLSSVPRKYDSDFNAEAKRLTTIYNARDKTFENPELTRAWAEIETKANAGLLILNKIARLEEVKPDGAEVISDALKNDDQQRDQAVENSVLKWGAATINQSMLQEQFRSVEGELNGAIAGLAPIGDSLSRRDLPNAISVSYLPSWQGTLWGDSVSVENTSGSTLSDGIVSVTTHSKDGSTQSHLHFVDQWPSGTKLWAEYPYQASDYANAQAGENLTSVDVALYTPNGTARNSYTLSQADWDEDVKSYCARLSFRAQYLGAYDEQATGKHYPAGFEFQFAGLPQIPIREVAGKFTDASGQVQQISWAYDPGSVIKAGDPPQSLRSPLLSETAPTHIEFTLKFPGTNFEQNVTVY